MKVLGRVNFHAVGIMMSSSRLGNHKHKEYNSNKDFKLVAIAINFRSSDDYLNDITIKKITVTSECKCD